MQSRKIQVACFFFFFPPNAERVHLIDSKRYALLFIWLVLSCRVVSSGMFLRLLEFFGSFSSFVRSLHTSLLLFHQIAKVENWMMNCAQVRCPGYWTVLDTNEPQLQRQPHRDRHSYRWCTANTHPPSNTLSLSCLWSLVSLFFSSYLMQ